MSIKFETCNGYTMGKQSNLYCETSNKTCNAKRSLHSPPSLSPSSPFSTAYFSIPFTSSKEADTCTDDVLLRTQNTNGEDNTDGAHMSKDVACTNRMHVQHDLARRKLHWASLTMGTQGRQKSFQDTDFMPALRRGGRPCDQHSPGVCRSNGVQ